LSSSPRAPRATCGARHPKPAPSRIRRRSSCAEQIRR
jgi:hypothetical protein